jgi:hypothetical protein
MHTGGEGGDLLSAPAAMTFEASALAAAAEATVESVVAAAETPAYTTGGGTVRTTGQLLRITTEAAEFPDMRSNTSILPKPQNWNEMGKMQRRRWYKSAGQHRNTVLERQQEGKWQCQKTSSNGS